MMLFYNEKIFKRCFNYSSKYWYKNIKEIPLYFKLMHHLIKNGYDEYAEWETFDWFIDTMRSILPKYRSEHHGYPVVSWDDEEKQIQSEIEYDSDLNRMISLLDDMDEDSPKYEAEKYQKDCKKIYEEMYAAKDEFFKLFAKHFYTLWD